ncbi:MAG: hypothetical protein RBS68_02335 [Anaerolineales bacterium]|nr:hypothetical protein [Anaerolineales bacterium]
MTLEAVGLAAHGFKGNVGFALMLPLVGTALAGGMAGATLAEKKLSVRALQHVFAIVIMVAALKAGIDALFR